MSPESTSTRSASGTRSRWDIVSDLAEQPSESLAAYCQTVLQALSDDDDILAWAVWRVDPGEAEMQLLFDGGVGDSPLVTEEGMNAEHQAWLTTARDEEGLASHVWERTSEPGFGPFLGLGGRLCPGSRCLAVLEVITHVPVGDEETVETFVQQLAQLLEARWINAIPTRERPEEEDAVLFTWEEAPATVESPTPEAPVVSTPATAPTSTTGASIPRADETKPSAKPGHRDSSSATAATPRELPTVKLAAPAPVTPGRPPQMDRWTVTTTPSGPPQQSGVAQAPAMAMPQFVPTAPPPFNKPASPPTGKMPNGPVAPQAGPDASARWQTLMELITRWQSRLSTQFVAESAANDGRQWLGCDRVTVLTGRRPRIKSVSGLARWSRRSPWVTRLERLCERVVRGAELLVFPREADDTPPEIAEPLADYLSEAAPRQLIVYPLIAVDRDDRDPDRISQRQHVVGCIVAEQLIRGEQGQGLLTSLEQLSKPLARTLQTASQYESVWLLPVWRAIGQASRAMTASRLAIGAAVLGLLAAVIAVLVLVPWDYRIDADGKLLPRDRRDVFAPLDGEVQEVLVESGQHVTAGTLLMTLRNPELNADLVTVRTDLDEKRKLFRALQFQIDQTQKQGDRELLVQLFGRLEETRAEISGLEQKVQILTQRQDQLSVRAPVSGTVATFQLDQLLRHRPVQRGEVLVAVMDESGPWQLDLNLDEGRLGHLLRAQTEHPGSLPVEYVLVTSPEQHYSARLREVATRSSLSSDDRLVVRLVADPNDEKPPIRRIGAEVRARIACGSKPLGYVLFGDVIEFVQRYLWW